MDTARRPSLRLGRDRGAVPFGDLPALRGPARRTLALRLLLALALLALTAGSVAFARNLNTSKTALLPKGSSGVVILDLSRSIDLGSLRRIGGVLTELIKADSPLGLVIFSDVAYELLPPRTPARELRPLLRFFTETHGKIPVNPWAPVFRAGTKISAGLELARSMLRSAGIDNGSILLVSDLGTSSADRDRLTQDLISFRNSKPPLRIVPLSPVPENLAYFQRLIGKSAFVASANAIFGKRSPLAGFRSASTQPLALLLVGGAILLLLALNELWCGQLELPGKERRR